MKGKDEYRRQLRATRRKSGYQRRLGYSVPNAEPRSTREGEDEWFKNIYDASGLVEYLTKDSRKYDPTYCFFPDGIKLNILA